MHFPSAYDFPYGSCSSRNIKTNSHVFLCPSLPRTMYFSPFCKIYASQMLHEKSPFSMSNNKCDQWERVRERKKQALSTWVSIPGKFKKRQRREKICFAIIMAEWTGEKWSELDSTTALSSIPTQPLDFRLFPGTLLDRGLAHVKLFKLTFPFSLVLSHIKYYTFSSS